ncbi:hypothetical protein EDD86DRAFT_208885 [Gorgonomyces haynaldii]|nr:hypothetical protein EDD86DRAFT_208885 [Gorgonomyces haynaldii]
MKTFNVANFTHGLTSKQAGVVEIMILHALDKVVFAKDKFLKTVDIVEASKRHLQPTKQHNDETESVQMEDGSTRQIPVHLATYEKTIYNMEKDLRNANMVLSRLLWSYEILPIKDNPDMPLNYGDSLNWKQIHYKKLRTQLEDIFSKKPLLPLNPTQRVHKQPLRRYDSERVIELDRKYVQMNDDSSPLVHQFPALPQKDKVN